jgi:hypothetical protein
VGVIEVREEIERREGERGREREREREERYCDKRSN